MLWAPQAWRAIDLVVRYSSKPSGPLSRPMPLLLTPPKGAFGAIPAKLTPMLPVSTR